MKHNDAYYAARARSYTINRIAIFIVMLTLVAVLIGRAL